MTMSYALSQAGAEEYLNHIEVLAGELNSAMDAMVAMELPAFERSVHRQRLICADIAALPHRAGSQPAAESAGIEPADEQLRARLKDASRTLHLLNKQYSALLEHSGETLKVLSGLLRTYSPPTPSNRFEPRVQTWSCTV